MAKANVVIVGNGSAALAALEAIHRTDPRLKSLVISAEDCPPYSPTALPYFFAGKIREQHLFLRDDSFYREKNAELVRGARVVRILLQDRRVVLEDGRDVGYDKLLIATGASPILPAIEGLNEVRHFVFRTLKDAKELLSYAEGRRKAVVLGGGLVGMETASGLIKKGLKVTVMEKEERVLPVYFDSEAADIIKGIYEENGVTLLTGETAVKVGMDGERVIIRTLSGREIEAEIFVVAAGMAPSIEPVMDSGIACRRGILVDDTMRTNIEGVYAAGDVAEARSFFGPEKVLNAILPDAVEQGRVAGANIAGGDERYSGGLPLNIFSFFGNWAFSCGLPLVEGKDYKVIKRSYGYGGRYRRLVFKEGRLIGVALINDGVDPGILHSFIRKGTDLSELMDGLERDLINLSRYTMIRSESPELPEAI